MGIIDINVLNATVVVIFASCIISAIVTERTARRIVLKEAPQQYETEKVDRILIPVSNPTNILPLVEYANLIRTHSKKSPIYILNVVKDEDQISSKLSKNIEELSAKSEIHTEFVVRMDINISSGIVRASKEIMASKIIMGWNGNYSTKQWFFGTILEGVLRDCRQPVHVVNLNATINNINEIYIQVPPAAEFEPSFRNWLMAISNLAKQTSSKITFFTMPKSKEGFENALLANNFKLKYNIVNSTDWYSTFDLFTTTSSETLIVIISARKGSISYSSRIELIPRIVSKKLRNKNLAIIYPEQHESTVTDTRAFLSGTGQVGFNDDIYS